MTTIKTTIKYDNCKNCARKCEHAGKDREFVCPGGVSCKLTYTPETLAASVEMFISAIKTIANRPENLENLENYLLHHFPEWLNKYANTPEKIAEELNNFAEMNI